MNKRFLWKGIGFCKARHVHEHDDFCNEPTIKNGEYCNRCTCSVRGCKSKWGRLWPLIPGEPRLCSYHNKKPPKGYWANLVEKANAPPDDFDIPDY